MSEFGDYEPEDAWHPDDALVLLIENLHARLDLLDGSSAHDRRVAQLDEIAHRLSPWVLRRGTLDARTELRVAQLIDDLALLRAPRG